MRFEIGFDPVIAQLGPLQIGWHGVFTALAVLVAVWLGTWLAERRGAPAEALGSVATWGLVGGLIGARLCHVLDHLEAYRASPLAVLAVWEGGIAVYGAFIGGVAAGALAARRAALPIWPLLDAAAPAMLIGQAIGRLGCLSNGDAWGGPCSGPLCVVYTHPRALLPPDLLDVPTHPYPLYELLAVLLLLPFLELVRRRSGRAGSVFLVAVLGYAVIRFGLSFLRQEARLLWGLQEAQLLALATGLAALVLLLRSRRRSGADARLEVGHR